MSILRPDDAAKQTRLRLIDVPLERIEELISRSEVAHGNIMAESDGTPFIVTLLAGHDASPTPLVLPTSPPGTATPTTQCPTAYLTPGDPLTIVTMTRAGVPVQILGVAARDDDGPLLSSIVGNQAQEKLFPFASPAGINPHAPIKLRRSTRVMRILDHVTGKPWSTDIQEQPLLFDGTDRTYTLIVVRCGLASEARLGMQHAALTRAVRSSGQRLLVGHSAVPYGNLVNKASALAVADQVTPLVAFRFTLTKVQETPRQDPMRAAS